MRATRTRSPADIFSERFLIKRPLLQALEPSPKGPPVLLIDELDRTDEPFEAFLLGDPVGFPGHDPGNRRGQGGGAAARHHHLQPHAEIHDAIKRRCFYYWVDYPNAARELEILRTKVPAAELDLAEEVVAFVQKLRGRELFKLPGVAETIDWADALLQLDQTSLSPEVIDNSLGALLKYQDDIAKIRGTEAAAILDEIELEISAARVNPSAGPDAWRRSVMRRRRAKAASSRTSCISPACCAARACRSVRARCWTPSTAVKAAGIGSRDDFYWTLHAVFVQPPRPAQIVRPGLPRLLAQPAVPAADDGRCCCRASSRASSRIRRRKIGARVADALQGDRPQQAPESAAKMEEVDARCRPHLFRPRAAAGEGFRDDDRGRDRRGQDA